jgi:hypothetical protein
MRKQFKVLTVFVLIGVLACLSGIFTGCGSSDKDKAMAVADKLEAVVEKYTEKIKEKKDAKDMAGMQQVMQDFQKETESIVKELEGLKGNLSDKEKEEVEKRFEAIGKKMMQMFQP